MTHFSWRSLFRFHRDLFRIHGEVYSDFIALFRIHGDLLRVLEGNNQASWVGLFRTFDRCIQDFDTCIQDFGQKQDWYYLVFIRKHDSVSKT